MCCKCLQAAIKMFPSRGINRLDLNNDGIYRRLKQPFHRTLMRSLPLTKFIRILLNLLKNF